MTGPAPSLVDAIQNRYVIERELGRGGMATVYLARDLKHHRLVALKVLHPELAATLGPERFLREIHLTAHLQHPHILSVFDSGEAAGQLSASASLGSRSSRWTTPFRSRSRWLTRWATPTATG